MSDPDPVSRLEKLRFLEAVQARDLERTRRWIAEEEQRVAEAARRRETEEREIPDWILQTMINNRHESLMVHTGECFAGVGKRTKPISRQAAVEALARGAEPCNVCKPDVILGLIEP